MTKNHSDKPKKGYRRLGLILGVGFLTAGIIPLLLNRVNARRIGWESFETSANEMLERSRALGEIAQTFDEEVAMQSIGVNGHNGWYLRLDDRLDRAEQLHKSAKPPATKESLHELAFEFDNSDSFHFKLNQSSERIHEGILHIECPQENYYLQTIEDLDLDPSLVGTIEIRMRLREGRTAIIGWTDQLESDGANIPRGSKGSSILYTSPDGDFHTYTVDASVAFSRWRNGQRTIRRLFFQFSEVEGDEIDVDYIRLTSNSSSYSDEPFGRTYEQLDYHLRKAIYGATPHKLKFSFDVQARPATLDLGIGTIDSPNPVTFSVHCGDGTTTKTLFTETASSNDGWRDFRVDLSPWHGKAITLVLEADGDPGTIALWSSPVVYSKPEKKLNVIMLLEDTLRADHLSAYGYSRQTSPAKDEQLKRHGVLFEYAFAQAGATRPSCPSFMTGLYPSSTGVFNQGDHLNDKYLTLAEILRSQGFATAVFEENANAGRNNGLHQGFSYNRHMNRRKRIRSPEGRSEIRQWVESQADRNFFLYLHIIDPHGPYEPEEEFQNWHSALPVEDSSEWLARDPKIDAEWEKDPTAMGRKALYDGEIRQNDDFFRWLTNTLKELGKYEDTIIVFLSDHGEHMGEHYDLWTHGPPGFVQGIRTPLGFIIPKKISEGKSISAVAQNVDIVPTILDLCDIAYDHLLIQGDSLVPLMFEVDEGTLKNRIAYSEEAIDRQPHELSCGASMFFGEWHAINSRVFSSKRRKRKGKVAAFWNLRVFQFTRDNEEEDYVNTFFFDPIFKFRTHRMMTRFQAENRVIWEALGRDHDQPLTYDTESLEQLRRLGYLD